MTWVAIAATVLSAAVSAAGAIQQGNAARAAGNREAAIDERNKILADQDRIQAINTAELDAQDKRRENMRQLASIRAAYGSSGLELAGTPLDVLSDSSTELALDARRVSYEGEVQGRQGALRMLGLQESADTARAAGQNAHTAGIVNATSSLLSAGGKVAAYSAKNT